MKEKNMGTAMTEAATLVRAYYGSWQNGIATFDKERLTEILAEDLDFEGSIAGKRRGAAGFIIGLQRFVEGLKSPIQVQQQVEADDLAAVLYDAEIPGGSMRFAEFFRVEHGRIASIKLLYDAAQYRALGGR
ncbi:MAG: nuclear transport factor 2 family protein [Chloroflexi bacterium]|nr:MAG: nuclear transport factor 2 family protein [Chloroflexota bacterium]TME99003.1 MAG: nuclear transport factor 2 family protein [Chloroflexota bacterium]